MESEGSGLMAIKHRKDRSLLVAETEIRAEKDRPHRLHAYLWSSVEAMHANTHLAPGSNAIACFCPALTRVRYLGRGLSRHAVYKPFPLLGELHFVAGRWDTEVVHHELTHAALARLRAFGLIPEGMDMDEHEEPFCYVLGQWTDRVYRWLWKMDRNQRRPR